MKIRNKDSVIILAGKDKGKTGLVTKILKEKDQVVVEGGNKRIKHVKGRDGNPGDRVEVFAPIHVSNVSLIDPKSGKPTRIRYKKEGPEKTRISVRSGEIITGQEKTKEKKTSEKTKKDSSSKKS